MIRNRQCLIQINPIKRCLLLLVLFSSMLCTNAYAQPDCETDASNLIITLAADGTFSVTADDAVTAAFLGANLNDLVFTSTSFGTISADETMITGTCTDAVFGALDVTVEERPLGGGAPIGTCMTTFTFSDVTGPGVTCLDIDAHADNTASDATTTTATFDSDAGDCSAAITFAIPPATDECDGTYTTVISFADPSSIADITVAYDDTTMPQDVEITFPLGDTEFSITYTDENDNETVCGSYTVTVEDNEDPVYTMCPAPTGPATAFELTADDDCMFVYSSSNKGGFDLLPLVDDNCLAILTYELSGATLVAAGAASSDFLTGVTFNEGSTTVTWTLTDPASNGSLTCTYDVEVVDMTAPVFGTDCSASNFTGVTNTADCTIALTDEDSRAILAPVLGGDHDSDGGTTPDLAATLADNCEALGDIEITADYMVDGNPVTPITVTSITSLSAAVFPLGTTTVTLTFDDDNTATDGNISTCTFTVTVTDGVAPTIDGAAALANTVVSFNTDASSCDYTIKNTDTALMLTADDDCDDTPTITYIVDGNTLTTLVGYTFPLGSTGVMVQAEDDAGNLSDSDTSTPTVADPVTFTVQVQDMTPPTIGTDILPTDDDAIAAGVQVILETAADATDCSVTDPADIVPTDFTDNCPGDAVITYNISAGPNGIATTPITDLAGFPFEVTNGMPYSITYIITDAAGNAAPATDAFDLIVLDKAAPIFECEATYTAELQADGTITISLDDLIVGTFDATNPTCRIPGAPAGDVNDPAMDNCSARVVYFEYTGTAVGDELVCANYTDELTFDCEKVGTTEDITVFVRDFAEDENGDFAPNTTMCTVSVTYEDNIDPTITCPANIAMNADAGKCEKTITLPIPTIVMGTATNPSEVADNSNDGDDPADADCDLTIEFSTDGGTTFTVLDATSEEQVFPVGTTTVTYRVTDATGNVSDPTCDFDIVITDTENPTIDCEGEQTFAADGDCDYNYSGTSLVPLVSDNCPGDLTLTFTAPGATPASGNAIDFVTGVVFPEGTTTVTWMVSDVATLTATCMYDVVVEDMAGPTINCDLIQDIAGESNDTDTDGVGTADELTCERILDAADSETVLLPVFGRANTAAPGDPDNSIPVGLSDNCELLADIEITATYIPNDADVIDVAPMDGVPDNQVEVSGITDDTGLIGAIFPVGSTTVTLIFDDNDDPSVVGNTTECTFIVLVTDGQKPVINNCPAGTLGRNTTLPECTYTATGGEFDLAAGDVVDDCDTDPTVVYTINGTELTTTDGYVFPIGNTLVMVTATDDADNVSDACSFLVSVSDSNNPTFECPTGDYTFDINQDADGSTCGFVNDFNNDNFVPEAVVNATCSSDEVEFSYMLTDPSTTVTTVTTLDGETFALGTTMVVVTAMVDEDGDDATPLVAVAGNCTFNIIIEDENTAVFECPADFTVETTLDDANCGTEVSYIEPTVPGGACNTAPGSTVVRTVGPGPNEFFAVGATTVTYELRDDNDVVIDDCSFIVTVVDKTPPSFTCENRIVEVNSTDCEYVIPDDTLDPVFVDNCTSTVTTSYTLSDADGTIIGSGTGSLATNTLELGVTTVTYTFSDTQAPSNESICSYTITVLEPATTYTIVADDASTAVAEGDDGTNTTVNFTVTRDNTDCPVSVGFSVEGTGTNAAIPTLDLEDATGTLTFAVGESQASFSIVINGDNIVEDDETFNILLSSILGANVTPTPFVYTITNDDVAFSVDWINFTAEATAKNQVNLKWEVANSINTSHYVIERATDGKDFQDLGKVEATTASLYAFIDNLPTSGINYYRVREVETGGRTSLSNTINIKINSTQDITLYPNPTKGTVQLQSSVATDNIEIIVLDALGKIVLEQSVNSDNEINLSTLTPGLYFMQINIDGANYVRRIVKE